ncbi:MAG TPA: transcription termination/antitermination NusG family protein [Promineifilum sp.]|nr:transcription termination/antitermination NusG family protein [Promineifilum sp.]
MEQWYALHTKPHQESRVASRLAELDVETYLPLVRRVGRLRVRRPVVLFPCYLFAHLDLAHISAAQWQWTPGLRRIVTFDGAPAVIPPAIVDLIRNKVSQMDESDVPTPRLFNPGDPVRITRGPMTDMVALFEQDSTPAERVCVLLTFLGRVCRVEVDVTDLERVDSRPALAAPRPPRRTRGHGRRIRAVARPG